MAGSCAAEMLLQLQTHIHQDTDSHQGRIGMLDVLGSKSLTHHLFPLLRASKR